MENKKLSITYRFLKTIGFNYSESEYGQVSLFTVVAKFLKTFYFAMLGSMMNWWILEPINPRKLRPILLRRMGAKVGKNVFIGDHVRIDSGHANLITIGDRSHITGGCRLLCHQRNLIGYRVGDDASKLPYKLGEIIIGKGVMIGMESLIMPGVSIGDGAVVGAFSLVTKSIPSWTLATGRPVKSIKHFQERNN